LKRDHALFFKNFDNDKDGTIDRHECAEAMREYLGTAEGRGLLRRGASGGSKGALRPNSAPSSRSTASPKGPPTSCGSLPGGAPGRGNRVRGIPCTRRKGVSVCRCSIQREARTSRGPIWKGGLSRRRLMDRCRPLASTYSSRVSPKAPFGSWVVMHSRSGRKR